VKGVLTGHPNRPGPSRTVGGVDNRAEVREFLTSRRAAGLPDVGNRRVPGLRPGEVAALAGVPSDLLRTLVDLAGEHDIVALSGTSGGAICALLAWYGLAVGDAGDAVRRLNGFWRDNAATSFLERLKNFALVGLAQFEEFFAVPAISPYYYPEFARHALTRLLRAQVDFDRVAQLQDHDYDAHSGSDRGRAPLLLVGAVDVRTGKHMLFSSKPFPDDKGSTAKQRFGGRVTLDAILASAAVPPLFRAVHIGDSWFWDGLFSQKSSPFVTFLTSRSLFRTSSGLYVSIREAGCRSHHDG
jgi:predicted acylesterase/phospholipase RssA